jgi:Lon protease-like protein
MFSKKESKKPTQGVSRAKMEVQVEQLDAALVEQANLINQIYDVLIVENQGNTNNTEVEDVPRDKTIVGYLTESNKTVAAHNDVLAEILTELRATFGDIKVTSK